MHVILGIIYHSIGGFASGSFYMPYNKVKKWAWESYWIIGGIFSWLIVPPLAAYLTVPGFADIIRDASSTVLYFTFVMGLLWGIGGLTYGLGVRYLGMSLGNSVTLGFCAAFGAIVPSIYYSINPTAGKISFTDMLASPGGKIVLLGVLVCIIGIAISGKAGMMKENDISEEESKKSVAEFSLVKGLIIAVISGILSSFMNFGIEAGKPMADVAVAQGYNPLFQNNVAYVVILWGGLTTNMIWCAILSLKNKTYGDFVNTSSPIAKNVMFSALAGTTWFLQFFFYGMGESKLGNGASSWILHMSTIILTANMWGIVRHEWSGTSKKTKLTITAGIATIILSVFLVGIGNSM
ncbi:MAG: sugar:proton symporter [Bacteroidetes bacterium GWF2_42_66]|nr:MAG: sugar:proton symporter [Bacteroidetes bacterium GWA2_42_15]OFX97260.1 MAG: sugar:proton symporter [Bacteroidetes bacterium GWE2_42_39]OFY39897.1 MAG: sugar:proton symporter [Bacteroidetes bacterium GWF2_42_66]HBL78075.1 L-rhamnose/proton symporter RhaT [Prolixibacteraceae bacterium]HCR91979.1 L-rhamnose/proton symporter RhaT [Prolixibacteraceae bacterium]